MTNNNNNNAKENILLHSVENIMQNRFARYAKYIIQERALPDVRDGLKPVQRRIIYAMYQLGLSYDKQYKKSARIVGEVIGKYHPHGDTSIYDAMVRMSQPWKLNSPLVNMQGNNGSIDGDNPAAMRYTEVKLTKISSLLLEDLEKDTVKFISNFDESEKEPSVLSSYIPNILLNGASGIAAGYATNIPPHNLNELINALIEIIKNPKVELWDILNIIKGPDFPTGGIVQSKEGIVNAFKTGKGRVIISSKYHIEKNDLIITEIPYDVVKQDLIKKISVVADNFPNLNITDIRDETDRDGLRICISFQKNSNIESARKLLFKQTPLSISFNYNNVVIVNNEPKLLGIIDILKSYLEHYKLMFRKKIIYDLNKSKKQFEIVQGLIKAISILDQIIKTIRESLNRADAIENLINKFNFTNTQATAIVEMKLYRLTSTDKNKLEEDKNKLEEFILKNEKIIDKKSLFDKEIIKKLTNDKELYNTKRRSIIIDEIENLDIEEKEIINKKEVQIWISEQGYIKLIDKNKVTDINYDEFNKKPNDIIINSISTNNINNLILITNTGRYYLIPIHKIKSSTNKDIGVHINTISNMQGDTKIINSFVIENFENIEQQILLTTNKGFIKRVPIDKLKTKTLDSLKIINISNDDKVVSANLISSETKHCLIVSENGFAVKYNIEEIPVQGAPSKGVKAMNLNSDNIIKTMTITNEDKSFVIITNINKYKKINFDSLPFSIRPRKGSKIFDKFKKYDEKIISTEKIINNENILISLEDDKMIYSNLNKRSSSDLNAKTEKINFINSDSNIIFIKNLNTKTIQKNDSPAKYLGTIEKTVDISDEKKNENVSNLSSLVDDIQNTIDKKKKEQLSFSDNWNDEDWFDE